MSRVTLTIKERMLGTLAQAGRPMTTRELARKMRMQPDKISAMASKLYHYGFLDRAERPGNPRRQNNGTVYSWWPKPPPEGASP